MKKTILTTIAVMAMATGAFAGNVTETSAFSTNRVTQAQTDFYCQELSDRVMHNVEKHSFLGFEYETNLTTTSEDLKAHCKSASAKLEDMFGKPTAGDFQRAHNEREAQKVNETKKAELTSSSAQAQPRPNNIVDNFSEAIIENYRNCMDVAGSSAISALVSFHYFAEKCRSATNEFVTVSKDFLEAYNYEPKK